VPTTTDHLGSDRLSGVVERVTFHSPESGWSVLQVSPFGAPHTRVTVIVHQAKVFAGATMEFRGTWQQHPRYGEQLRCTHAVERKPASAAALEKYLGSGLIRGVGPRTARKIVAHFGAETLGVFEGDIGRLVEVRGIARRKLDTISQAWREHQAIRHVMMFLQEHGISTLFAVRIYQAYGDAAVDIVRADPYRLARDIYGIGFFSADRIAASLGFDPRGAARIDAGIRHVLAASREEGHCFLTGEQVEERTLTLLGLGGAGAADVPLRSALAALAERGEVRVRNLPRAVASRGAARADPGSDAATADTLACYYARTLYRDEETVARQVAARIASLPAFDAARAARWLDTWSLREKLVLSDAQRAAVLGIAAQRLSILTGGPGCGKTTATRALVRLARAMGRRVVLAAPTGRAAQRMSEVVGLEARTIHRLLEWSPVRGGFSRDAERPLPTDFLVVDETSMLDVSLAASLLQAVPPAAQVLFVGDPNQLPSVGAGDVLGDLLRAGAVPRFELTQVFRQADASQIVRFAHSIQRGEVPPISSPLARPEVWRQRVDCLFVDGEEATQEQIRFVRRARAVIERTLEDRRARDLVSDGRVVGRLERSASGGIEVKAAPAADAARDQADRTPEPFAIPRKFLRVDLEKLARTDAGVEELREVIGRVHPHSVLHHGLSLADAVRRLYTKTIPEQLGPDCEIQILTPMNRGSLGAAALNRAIQEAVTPARPGRAELRLGDRVFRAGDRVIQRRNDYELGVFNGDIGRIVAADSREMTCQVAFGAGTGAPIVTYAQGDLAQLALAYAITVHKSQGSEFDAVILPLVAQHHRMLFRGLVYTGLTRARRLAVFVGERRALALAVRNAEGAARQTALAHLLASQAGAAPRAGKDGARGEPPRRGR
jgi:exodeoxyribonuclease V alpha subunit